MLTTKERIKLINLMLEEYKNGVEWPYGNIFSDHLGICSLYRSTILKHNYPLEELLKTFPALGIIATLLGGISYSDFYWWTAGEW